MPHLLSRTCGGNTRSEMTRADCSEKRQARVKSQGPVLPPRNRPGARNRRRCPRQNPEGIVCYRDYKQPGGPIATLTGKPPRFIARQSKRQHRWHEAAISSNQFSFAL